MTKKETRESRSVRLSLDEWITAEALAQVVGGRGAGAGLRSALATAVDQLVSENTCGEDPYGVALCPGDDSHRFVWANDPEDGSTPQQGEWVACAGQIGDLPCGYLFVWRGLDEYIRARNLIEKRHQAGGR